MLWLRRPRRSKGQPQAHPPTKTIWLLRTQGSRWRRDVGEERRTTGICTCKHQTSTESGHEEVSHWYHRGYEAPARQIHTMEKQNNQHGRIGGAVTSFAAPDAIATH